MPAERVRSVDVRAFSIPTESPESDGTLAWDKTTIVVARVDAGGAEGIGYSYTHACAAELIRDLLGPRLVGRDPCDIPGAWAAMTASVRNLGAGGIAATAISALDVALWDVKCRLLEVPLLALLGAGRDSVPVYGSGGFTSYSDARLRDQLGGWVQAGMRAVKMKVGRDPAHDQARVRTARVAIGAGAELFVDANGAYEQKQALALAGAFRELGVSWFEEPVPSRELGRMRFIRERMPPGMELAGGEYSYSPSDAHALLDAQAVDVLQADATRCLGISGFMAIASICAAHAVPLSSHCAPALHAQLGCALPAVRHLEWFHDHVRIESMLFEGAPALVDGRIASDRSRPGLGLELKREDAEHFAA